MAGWLARRMLALAALAVVLPLCAWTLSGGPLRVIGDATEVSAPASSPGGETPPGGAVGGPSPIARAPSLSELAGRVRGVVSVAWRKLRLPVVLAVLVLLGLTLSRLHARSRRRLRRFWLLPYRVDEAQPEALEALYRAWHEQLACRWWQRLLSGQPALTLEIRVFHEDGAWRARLLLGCPQELTDALSGPLNACYPHTRLIPQASETVPSVVARLRKRYRFVRRLATPEHGETPPLMNSLLATLGALERRAVVQLALTPAPALFDYLARGLLHARERQLVDPDGPGLRARAAELELSGGEATQWKPLWFADIRVAADSRATCRRIGGAIQAASAENRLRERRMIVRAELYRRRIARGVGNPLPGWLKGVVSTAELAGLFQLPSPSLRGFGFERSSVPRAVAPPQVLRPSSRVPALGRDDLGYVALHAGDLEKNLALIGQIGSGKTSVLAKTTERDAHDRDCCVIVIDPNSTGVAAHLSAIPEDRTVHMLDVAQPECGFNPLLASGAVSKVADDVVEAFIDVHDTGEIMTSSRQFLGGAAEAVIGAHRHGALDHQPSLWDLYRVLLPNQQAFRAQLLDAIGADRELLGAATLLAEDIPQGLRDIGSQYALRMSAPRNKLFAMRSRNIDRVLRHPIQLSLREIIERREVLVVDGRMGSTGVAQTRVLVMFVLSLIFAELRRQMELDPAERVRVCLKLDEGHLVMGEHFATALSTLRAGRLETSVCYQYSAQLRDDVVRAGASSLLASRCVFQLSEPDDAEQMTKLAMSAYASSVRDDPESRARMAITPDAIMHLPRHWAICSWQAQGARVPAFAMNTLPLAVDESRIAQHRAQQQARGGFVPDVLPHPLLPAHAGPTRDPLREVEAAELGAELSGESVDADREQAQIDTLMRANGQPEARARPPRVADPGSAAQPARPTTTTAQPRKVSDDKTQGAAVSAGPALDERAELERVQAEVLALAKSEAGRQPDADGASKTGTRKDRQDARTGALTVPLEPRATNNDAVPETYLEVQLEPSGLAWDDSPVDPIDKAPTPDGRQLQALSALHRLGPLLSSQLEREFYPGVGERSVQRSLTAMRRAGWVRRFRLRERQGRGQPKYVYVLDRRGFELARDTPGPRGAYIPRDARFLDRRFESVIKPLHDLHANGLLFALLRQMPKAARGWKGPGESVVYPPKRRPRGESERPIRVEEIPLESPLRLKGIQLETFEAVKPDLTLEVLLVGSKGRRRFDLLVELDRSGNPHSDSNTRKLLRYDALLAGWHVLVERYRTLGHSPIVVVACEDEPTARRWAQVADELLTGRVSRMGDADTEAAFHGRTRIFFACELDLHRGKLRGYRVPHHPRDVRARLGGAKAARRVDLEQVTFLPEKYLR